MAAALAYQQFYDSSQPSGGADQRILLQVDQMSSQANAAATKIGWRSHDDLLAPLFEAAHKLVKLPENWDSYGGHRVSLFYAQYALELVSAFMRKNLPLPSLVPTTAGGVQLEWHTRGIDLEVKVESLRGVHVYFHDLRKNETYEEELEPASFIMLDRFLEELALRS
jgi:hypothetical protein